MPSSKRSPKRSAARRRWLVVTVVLVAAMAGAGYLVSRGFSTTTGSTTTAASVPSAGSTVAPASAVPEGDDPGADPRAGGGTPIATEPPDDVATDAPYEAPDGEAVVAISYADWDATSAAVKVNAFVSSAVEDGGDCTLTLTRGSDIRTVSGTAFADATTTICHALRIPGSQLGSGTWQAVVSYAGSADGDSDAVEVTVP